MLLISDGSLRKQKLIYVDMQLLQALMYCEKQVWWIHNMKLRF